MTRTFTQDVGTRWHRGDTADYPAGTWKQIAANVGKPLEKFTTLTKESRDEAEAGPRPHGRPRPVSAKGT